MTHTILRALAVLAVSLFGFSFTSCQTLEQAGLSGPLADAMEQVTGFSTDIGAWQSSLGNMLGDTQLGQLKGYADKAKDLGASISGMTGGLEAAMADPLAAIGNKLSEMGGLDMSMLGDLAPQAQMDSVKAFADQATSVGGMAKDFMANFGG